jgi:hypothetical protein
MYVCMYVCVCMYMYVWRVQVFISGRIKRRHIELLYVCIYMHILTPWHWINMHMWRLCQVFTKCTCTHTLTQTCICTHTHTHIHTHRQILSLKIECHVVHNLHLHAHTPTRPHAHYTHTHTTHARTHTHSRCNTKHESTGVIHHFKSRRDVIKTATCSRHILTLSPRNFDQIAQIH